VPKLWNDTIDEHRRTVHTAILDAAASQAAQHGLASVTMSQIAASAGIGRATLYKYFPDVDAILVAWHERQINHHLQQLVEARDSTPQPGRQLAAVLHTFALISHQHHGNDLAPALHQREHVHRAHQHLHDFITDLISRAATAGEVRGDINAGELATYCLHALTAASDLPSEAAVHRLVAITLDGLSVGTEPASRAEHAPRPALALGPDAPQDDA
jgi:AcrR family transcriptional regulator